MLLPAPPAIAMEASAAVWMHVAPLPATPSFTNSLKGCAKLPSVPGPWPEPSTQSGKLLPRLSISLTLREGILLSDVPRPKPLELCEGLLDPRCRHAQLVRLLFQSLLAHIDLLLVPRDGGRRDDAIRGVHLNPGIHLRVQ